jgi:hypothetical protein
MLHTYMEHIGADLPFNYCDSVARFYAHVFEVSSDDKVRRLVLTELFKLGPRHNRYPVADIVRELLWSLKDETRAAFVAGVIADTPEAAWYYHRQTLRGPLPPLIEDALAAADAEDEPEGLDASARSADRVFKQRAVARPTGPARRPAGASSRSHRPLR